MQGVKGVLVVVVGGRQSTFGDVKGRRRGSETKDGTTIEGERE